MLGGSLSTAHPQAPVHVADGAFIQAQRPRARPCRGFGVFTVSAQPTAAVEVATKPPWAGKPQLVPAVRLLAGVECIGLLDHGTCVPAGGGVVTDLVNMAISNKMLYGLMKIGAKRELKSTAEARGIAWDGNIADLQGQMQVRRIGVFDVQYGSQIRTCVPTRASMHAPAQVLEQIKAELEDNSIQYPEYYLKPFHAYEKVSCCVMPGAECKTVIDNPSGLSPAHCCVTQGNLDWMAAFEVEPATQSMYVRCWKEEKTLTPAVAGRRLRGAVTDAVKVQPCSAPACMLAWRYCTQ